MPRKPEEETKVGRAEGNVGEALRHAYEETIGEPIPDEMLDLLKKLD